jgi:hypothetical protein
LRLSALRLSALRLSALRLSAWGRLAMVAPIALALWAGVFWALH